MNVSKNWMTYLCRARAQESGVLISTPWDAVTTRPEVQAGFPKSHEVVWIFTNAVMHLGYL